LKKFKVLIAVFLGAIILSSCSKQAVETINKDMPSEKTGGAKQEEKVEMPVTIDYEKIKVNEAGKVMVLMYHGIGDKEEEWVRTADNFQKDLKTLYEKGYRTVSLHDYINNNINVPAGYTPVVITFDDGLLNQFNIIEKDGKFEIDPNCAVGIMKSFAKDHHEFKNEATFYVYYPLPFRQKEKVKEKLEYLINNGFDVGNHSYTHEMLGKMDGSSIQRQLALNVKMSLDYIPGYEVDTLALPYGSRPKDEALRKYMLSGQYEGTSYNNKAVLLVGSNPALSPNSKDFDASAIPRIRASEMKTGGTGIYDWLKYFDTYPGERYISDGDPKTNVVPKSQENKLNKDAIKDKQLIVY